MTQRSGLALAVLALLVEQPMHPYRMQQLLRERGKGGEVVNVGQRSQLYKTIDRLARDGLITEHVTERESARPERTVYAVTDSGRETAAEWAEEMLSAPRPDFPEFLAALAHAALLDPPVVLRALESRLITLRSRSAGLRAGMDAVAGLPRVLLVEGEYMSALLDAEIGWLDSVVADLRDGTLDWSLNELREFSERADRAP